MVSFRGRSYRDTCAHESDQSRRMIVLQRTYTLSIEIILWQRWKFLNRGANSRIRFENWKLIETIVVKIETLPPPRRLILPPSAFFPAFHRLFPCFSMSEHDTPDWFNSIRMIGYSIPVSRTNKWKVENDKMWWGRGGVWYNDVGDRIPLELIVLRKFGRRIFFSQTFPQKCSFVLIYKNFNDE